MQNKFSSSYPWKEFFSKPIKQRQTSIELKGEGSLYTAVKQEEWHYNWKATILRPLKISCHLLKFSNKFYEMSKGFEVRQ